MGLDEDDNGKNEVGRLLNLFTSYDGSVGCSETGMSDSVGGEAGPCVYGHIWKNLTQVVHHEEVGHYEEVLVDYAWKKEYRCAGSACEDLSWMTYDEIVAHYRKEPHCWSENTLNYDLIELNSYSTAEEVPVYEQQWVVDAAAYDETVVVGQACRRCGKAK